MERVKVGDLAGTNRRERDVSIISLSAQAFDLRDADVVFLALPDIRQSECCSTVAVRRDGLQRDMARDRIELPTRGFSVRCSTN